MIVPPFTSNTPELPIALLLPSAILSPILMRLRVANDTKCSSLYSSAKICSRSSHRAGFLAIVRMSMVNHPVHEAHLVRYFLNCWEKIKIKKYVDELKTRLLNRLRNQTSFDEVTTRLAPPSFLIVPENRWAFFQPDIKILSLKTLFLRHDPTSITQSGGLSLHEFSSPTMPCSIHSSVNDKAIKSLLYNLVLFNSTFLQSVCILSEPHTAAAYEIARGGRLCSGSQCTM